MRKNITRALSMALVMVMMLAVFPITAGAASPPAVSSATINGSTLVITFDDSLSGTVADTSAFTVSGVTGTITSAVVSGTTVTLTLSNVAVSTDTVVVSYAPSGTNNLTDGTNAVVAFNNQTVTNNTPTPPSSAALVTGISGLTSPVIGANTITSTMAVGTTSVNLTATVSANATVTYWSDAACTVSPLSGTAITAFTVSTGTNTAYIKVVAQDGTTTNIYTVTITVTAPAPPSSAALVTGISGLTSPVIGANTITSTMAAGTTSVNLTATVSANATVTYWSDAACTVSPLSGTAITAFTVSTGTNTAYIKVVAQDGTTTNIYTVTITVTAPLSSAALVTAVTGLTSPSISTVSSNKGTITSTMAAGTTSVNLTATVSANATVTYWSDAACTISPLSGTAITAFTVSTGTNTAYIKVVAQDGTTNIYTVIVTVSTAATVPGAPTSFTATAGNAQVVLSWSAPSSNGGAAITGYNIYRNGVLLTSVASTVTSYTATSLTNNTAYTFYVCAVNSVGEGTATTTLTRTPTSSTYFTTAPYNLKATAGSKQVKLTWTKSTPTPSYYRVYYGTSTSNMSSYTTTSNTSCTVTGLTNSQRYYFYVEAYTSGQTSASTSTVNATPSSSASTNDDLWVSTSSNSSSDSISTYKFTTKSEGYSSISATTFYIHNDSGSKIYGVDVALSGTNKSDFTLSVSSTSDSISDGSYTTFTIKPDTGLSDGTYKATVKVTSDDTSSYSFTITFIVGDGSDDEFYFSTTKSGSGVSKYSLDSLKAGYSSAPSTTFYVQNETGSSLKKVTLALSGTDKSSFTLSETSLGTISDDSYTTFTVTPKTGLAAGSYTAKITATASDDSTATLTLNLTVTAATTTPTTPVTPSYVFPFSDVATGAWYYNDVLKANQQGLIDGYNANNATQFKPDENLSVAQAIKLAACVHQRYYNGSVTLTNGYPNWYDTYVTYAKNNGIISGDYLDYNAKITREEFVNIFYNALPASDYTILNTLSDTYIPDVQPGATYYSKIFRFYQAGILQGNGSGFSPKNNIKRSEVAAILTRLYDSSERISS